MGEDKDDLLERCARAVYVREHPDDPGATFWDSDSEGTRDCYRNLARAALQEAARDPGAGAVEAGARVYSRAPDHERDVFDNGIPHDADRMRVALTSSLKHMAGEGER